MRSFRHSYYPYPLIRIIRHGQNPKIEREGGFRKGREKASKTDVGPNDSEEDSEVTVKGERKRSVDDLDFDDWDQGSGEWSGQQA